MINYRQQNCCYNCKHGCQISDYDEWPEYYCTLNAPPRPKSMSVQMGEYVGSLDEEAWDEANSEWDAWKDGRSIEQFGICDSYEKFDREEQ